MSGSHLTKAQLLKGMPTFIHVLGIQEQKLIIQGQGVSSVVTGECKAFTWRVYNNEKTVGLKMEVMDSHIALYEVMIEGDFDENKEETKRIAMLEGPQVGVDSDPDCLYWFSIDGPNQCVSYGKGEMRPATEILNKKIEGDWLKSLSSIAINTSSESNIWRDPVTINPSLIVMDTDKISMMEMASNSATVPANLTPACQTIYANISGDNFELNSPDFPEFTDAIEASIKDPQGWCYQTLREKAKADEFGGEDPLLETYLRITLGVNQGDSPGVPNVMEIWPPGHHSPIHNHGDANAIIRVLHGEISVDLYAMLSTKHTTAFATKTFCNNQVTWLSPGLNQIHKLTNKKVNGPTCITIQSYKYSENNTFHYEYFDFISGDQICPFTPNSDMDFIKFKQTMKNEWVLRQRVTSDLECEKSKVLA